MFVEIAANQASQFSGAEPGLGFDPETMEVAVVAGETDGFIEVSHG